VKHLDKRVVLHLHARLIDLFGGGHGLRDEGLLESALAQPMAEFDGTPLHTDVFEMAAAYGFHLCRNHPFLDGNKRIAAVAMGTFLRLNGVDARFDEVSLYAAIMAVADGRLDKAGLTAWLRKVLSGPARISRS
jgi:death on curing protein